MNRHAIPTALFAFVNMSCYQHIIATRLIIYAALKRMTLGIPCRKVTEMN